MAFSFFTPVLLVHSVPRVMIFLCVGFVIMGGLFGPCGVYLPELFPTHVRYSGAGLSYNLAAIFGGAFAPTIAEFYGQPSETPPFATWQQAFDYIAKRERESSTPMVLVFDEFPYAALANNSLPSVLQIAIDHDLKRTNVMLIVSGSNEGFMESKVLGSKSPLFGRCTA